MEYFQKYFEYIGESEAPKIYHRWAAISAVGSILGRQFHFPFGHTELYPNMYIMLMGSPGTRKSTAVNAAKKVLKLAGYTRFAADRLSKEMFLKSMCHNPVPDLDGTCIEDLLELIPENGHEIHIIADEFTDFIGPGNMEFLTMLTKLWDCPDSYVHPKLTGQDVIVDEPTVNLLSGNTPMGFALAFPPEAVGQGFTSRLIFVHSDPSGKMIPWPTPPEEHALDAVSEHLKAIKDEIKGAAILTDDARLLAEDMYAKFEPLDDHRFVNYTTRRQTHLLKLALCMAAADLSRVITAEHMLQANTLLHYTECNMSKALGEYGRGRNSPVQQDILSILNKATKPVTMNELWRSVGADLTRQSELVEIVKGLLVARKAQSKQINGHDIGFLPLHTVRKEWGKGLLLDSFLSLEEIG